MSKVFLLFEQNEAEVKLAQIMLGEISLSLCVSTDS